MHSVTHRMVNTFTIGMTSSLCQVRKPIPIRTPNMKTLKQTLAHAVPVVCCCPPLASKFAFTFALTLGVVGLEPSEPSADDTVRRFPFQL